ncbi:hypothetical protein BDW22DRAFT_1334207 [Trametopsis cervina]|nr:hypothetical protein BDW22DRAFT_1334207 [Trametopsis cervina]
MHIKQVKIRPRKAQPHNPCGAELMNLLQCWTASKDLHSIGPCAEASLAVMQCMRTTPFSGKKHKPSINYHLRRLNKIL